MTGRAIETSLSLARATCPTHSPRGLEGPHAYALRQTQQTLIASGHRLQLRLWLCPSLQLCCRDVNDQKGEAACIVSQGEEDPAFATAVGFGRKDGALCVAGKPLDTNTDPINSPCSFMKAVEADASDATRTHQIIWVPCNTITLMVASSQFHCPREKPIKLGYFYELAGVI